MGNIIPIIPPAMDLWIMRDVANAATIIRTMALTRSDQGARLKNSHHTTIANAPTSPPITPNIMVSGTRIGATNLTSSSSTAGRRRATAGAVSASVRRSARSSYSSPEQVREFGQFLLVEIGDYAIAQSIRIAVDDRIAAMLLPIR